MKKIKEEEKEEKNHKKAHTKKCNNLKFRCRQKKWAFLLVLPFNPKATER